jgi:hypothetical protein
MAWIESHQSLLTHRKTLRAASLLKISKYRLIGHLHALWWWCLDNAEDGDLSHIDDREIAVAVGWPVGKATAFIDALTLAGFIDLLPRSVDLLPRRLHDWDVYSGKLVARRQCDAQRKRDERAKQIGNSPPVPETSAGRPSDVPETSCGTVPTNPTNPTDQPHQQTQPSTLPTLPSKGGTGRRRQRRDDGQPLSGRFRDWVHH